MINAVREGKTQKIWSKSTIKRLASYLVGTCSDYGLLSPGRSSVKQINSIRLYEQTLLFFAYWLHFSDHGDNAILNHEIWTIFGLEPMDVREELKRISKKGWLIVQSAGDVIKIGWTYKSMEEVINVIIKC